MMHRKTMYLGLLLIVLALGLRGLFFSGLVFSDDTFLYLDALELLHGFSLPKLLASCYGRYGMPFGLWGISSLFGVGEQSVLILGMLISTATFGVGALLGRNLLQHVSLILLALVLMAFSPMDITYSVTAFPDAMSHLEALFGVFVLYAAIKTDHPQKQFLFYLLFGVLIGFSLPMKESATLLLLLMLPLATLTCTVGTSFFKKINLIITGGLGFLAVLATEMLANAMIFGNALFRFAGRGAGNASTEFYNGYRFTNLLDKWGEWLSHFAAEDTFDLLIIAFSLGVSAVFIKRFWKENSSSRFLLVWFLCALAVLGASTLFTYSYQPRRVLPLLLPALFILCQGVTFLRSTTEGVTALWRKVMLPVSSALLVLALGFSMTILVNGRFHPQALSMKLLPAYCRYKVQPFHDIADLLEARAQDFSDRTLYTDTRTLRALKLFSPHLIGKTLNVLDIESPEFEEQFKSGVSNDDSSVIVVNHAMLQFYARGHDFPNLLFAPPLSWKTLFYKNYHALDSSVVAYQNAPMPPGRASSVSALPLSNFDLRDHRPGNWEIHPENHPAQFQYRQDKTREPALQVDMKGTSDPVSLTTPEIKIHPKLISSHSRYRLNFKTVSNSHQMLEIFVVEHYPGGKQKHISLRRERANDQQKALETGFIPKPNTASIQIGIEIKGKGILSLSPVTLVREELTAASSR